MKKAKEKREVMRKMDKRIQEDIDSGRMEIKVKDICFICGKKINDTGDPFVRYCRQGNSCNECNTCSSFSRSNNPEKKLRYKQWCLKLDLLNNRK